MADDPAIWVRVSTPAGHFTVPAAVADPSWRVLKQPALDSTGRPLPPKLREAIPAATPATPKPGPASGDTPKEN